MSRSLVLLPLSRAWVELRPEELAAGEPDGGEVAAVVAVAPVVAAEPSAEVPADAVAAAEVVAAAGVVVDGRLV